MGLEYKIILMEYFIMDTGKIIREVAKVCRLGLMVDGIKESGVMIIWTEEVFKLSLDKDMMVSLKMGLLLEQVSYWIH